MGHADFPAERALTQLCAQAGCPESSSQLHALASFLVSLAVPLRLCPPPAAGASFLMAAVVPSPRSVSILAYVYTFVNRRIYIFPFCQCRPNMKGPSC